MFIGSVMDQIVRVKLVLMAAQFLSLLLMALTTGIVFSHLLQRGPKATLPAPVFLSIQQTLLRNYGVAVGAIEAGAFVSTLVTTILVRAGTTMLALNAMACACVAVMIAVW